MKHIMPPPARYMRTCMAIMIVMVSTQTAVPEEKVFNAVGHRKDTINTVIDFNGKESAETTAPPADTQLNTEPIDISTVNLERTENEPPEVMTNAQARLSLNFKNGDLRNILRLIARISGMNIIAGPDIKGSVTVQLNDVEWEKALALILSVNGFAYVRDGNIIRVMTPDKMEKEPLAVRVIPVNYAQASELLPVLTPLLTPQRGSIKSENRANVLIATDIPARINEVQKVVERLDQPTPQVLIDVKFIEITEGDTDTQGTDWTPMGDYGVLLDEMLYTFDKQINNTKTRNNAFGTDSMMAQRTRAYSKTVDEAMTYQLAPDQFRLAISMLLNDSRSRLISHPKVQTLDNKQATIRVAETRYKPKFTYNKETGAYEISNLDEIYVGITLSVTPHINHDNNVTLDILPEVSALADVQVIEGFEVPITNVREVDTRVTLKDRYTVAIGGMVNDSWQYTERSLPFFGDIPYIGETLFSWRKKEKKAINLVIFITPTVIIPDEPHDRFDEQLNNMHVSHQGEWIEEKVNYPDWHMMALREKMLIDSVETNSVNAFTDELQ